MTALPPHWPDDTQAYLAACLAELRGIVERAGGQASGQEQPSRRPLDPSAPLERLAETFSLSGFERDLLLLCAGMELDAGFARACREAARGEPSFGFALATLPGAHWSALTPTGPLRYWRLLEVRDSVSLTASPLRIDERVLHTLAGTPHLDQRLHGILRPHRPPAALPDSHRQIADRIAALWAGAAAQGDALPAVQLLGEDDAGGADIAASACAVHGASLCVMQACDLPQSSGERAAFDRLWAREALLGDCALLIATGAADGQETLRAAAAFAARSRSGVFVTCRDKLNAPAPIAQFALGKPSRAEQAALWLSALSRHTHEAAETLARNDVVASRVAAIVCHFDFAPAAIAAVSDLVFAAAAAHDAETVAASLWDGCRAQARGRLDGFAQRITTAAGWDELVLPEEQRQALNEIAVTMRQRTTVYDRWGFAGKGQRGLGVSALFAGASGTGKTLAAEIVAHELGLDLYRIDLSRVVSKYIGETEKNLERVFTEAESASAVLLFDEADALFGKRSEVRDSHDRYANMEVSYLLQRMESYGGLAILTTNLPQALDPAFRRRIRFVVQFPFPDACERMAIWARAFPEQTPTEGLDTALLARLNVGGGNIRNIALGAAFLAAEEGHAVTMPHLLRSARAECAKLGRRLTDAEVAGWA